MEEAGVNIKNIRLGTITNDIMKDDEKHYITIFMIADYHSGDVEIREPDRCERWEWFSWHEMPDNIFLPLINLKKTTFLLQNQPSVVNDQKKENPELYNS